MGARWLVWTRTPRTSRTPKMVSLRWVVLALVCMLPTLIGCAAVNYADTPQTIVLLAPFEGRYRDLGYDALYATRLALAEADTDDIYIIPIDDGGLVSSAAQRVQALQHDDTISAVIAVGYAATDPAVDYGSLPVIVVGEWGQPTGEAVYVASSPEIGAALTTPSPLDLADAMPQAAPFTGPDVLALPGFAEGRADLSDITVLSSGSLPDADYIARILGHDQFATEPGLLSTLIYDVTQLTIRAAHTGNPISAIDHTGINGTIRFDEAGYWQNAPVNRYEFDADGNLITS